MKYIILILLFSYSFQFQVKCNVNLPRVLEQNTIPSVDCRMGHKCQSTCKQVLYDYFKKATQPKTQGIAVATNLIFVIGDNIENLSPNRNGATGMVDLSRYPQDSSNYKDVYFDVNDSRLFAERCVRKLGDPNEKLFSYLKYKVNVRTERDKFIGGVFRIWSLRYIQFCSENYQSQERLLRSQYLNYENTMMEKYIGKNWKTSQLVKNIDELYKTEGLCNCNSFKGTSLDTEKRNLHILRQCWNLNKQLFPVSERACGGFECMKMIELSLRKWDGDFRLFLNEYFNINIPARERKPYGPIMETCSIVPVVEYVNECKKWKNKKLPRQCQTYKQVKKRVKECRNVPVNCGYRNIKVCRNGPRCHQRVWKCGQRRVCSKVWRWNSVCKKYAPQKYEKVCVKNVRKKVQKRITKCERHFD